MDKAPDSLSILLEGRKKTLPRSLPKTKKLYVAYESSDRERRYIEFRFSYPNSTICLPYSQLIDIRGEWRMGQWIDMYFSRAGKVIPVKIVGKNLQEIYYSILEWKATGVEEFDSRFHKLTDENKLSPFVRKINFGDDDANSVHENKVN